MNRNIVILGGGLAGLSAAYHSGGVVYEKQGVVGGTCISPEVDGFIFDLGIHVLHTRDRYVLELLIDILKCRMQAKRRSAWIYSNKIMTKYPFQVNTFGLSRDIKKSCIDGFRKVCRANITKTDYKNYKEWIYSKFGKGIAEHFYLPYSEKFWTIPAEEMTTDWLDVRVPIPKLEDVIKGATSRNAREFGPNAEFRYPEKEGISALPNGFANAGLNLKLEKEVTSIDTAKKIIKFSDEETINYDNLISTIPLPDLVGFIKDIPDEIIKSAKLLRCNSIFCIYLGIEREKINDMHWLYFPESEFPFFRVSFPMNLSQSCTPKRYSSIMAEVSYSRHKDIDKANIVDETIKALVKAGVLRDTDKIEKIGSYDIKYGYPIYDHNRKKATSSIERYLRNKSIFPAGRYGKWEYLWMHDVILDGKRVAEEVKKRKI